RIGDDFFREEIAKQIKGNGLETDDQCLEAPRYGRKTPLRAEARRAAWAVYQAYRARLSGAGLVDFADRYLLAQRELSFRPLTPGYDHVIVDEAQDMTATQVKVAQLMAGHEPGRSIFLVGDVAQSLYSRGFTWKQAGL